MQIKELADNLGLNEDEFMEMVELYLDTSHADFSEMEAAIAAGNAEKLAERAHSIKGASGNLGFTDVYESAKIIEKASRDGVLDSVNKTMADLKNHLAAITSQYTPS